MKLKLIYFYPDELNLYGDRGNIEILKIRAEQRNIGVAVEEIGTNTKIDKNIFNDNCIIFMGGGPDSGQKVMYEDLIKTKTPYIKDYIEQNGVALFICGAYQLIGKYYKSADGTIIDGANIFDFYTEQTQKERCVGNLSCRLSGDILSDKVFKNINSIGQTLIGFENHGGRTYLNQKYTAFGSVMHGFGNNGEDNKEGIYYKNTIGTYLHGPLLSKNPHIADFLIAKALKLDTLQPIDDDIIKKAHSALIRKYR